MGLGYTSYTHSNSGISKLLWLLSGSYSYSMLEWGGGKPQVIYQHSCSTWQFVRKLWICALYGVYLVWCVFWCWCRRMSTCFVSLSPSTPNLQIHNVCYDDMCVPLTLKLFMVYVLNLIPGHPPSLPYATGSCLGTRLPLWTAFYIALSVMFP